MGSWIFLITQLCGPRNLDFMVVSQKNFYDILSMKVNRVMITWMYSKGRSYYFNGNEKTQKT